MRDGSLIRPSVCGDTDLARCGLAAIVLYQQARLKCDNYGRLPGHPERLATEVLPALVLTEQLTLAQVEAARDALVRAGFWHLYRVESQVYVECIGYDADQVPSYLRRRSGQPTYPDPPDRPELWARNRPHYTPKGQEPPAAAYQPSTAVPTGGEPQTEVPSSATEQGAVPAGAGVPSPASDATVPIKQTREYREFEQVCRDNGLEAWLREAAFIQLVNAARGTPGREWGILVEVATEAAVSAKGQSPGPRYGCRIIENLPGTVLTREQARAHFAGEAAPARAAPQTEDEAPPEDTPEDLRRRALLKAQLDNARSAHAS